MKSKRAVSHLEMIVSFTIFLLFVTFLFTYMSPIKEPDISGSLLKTAEQGIENYSTTSLNVPVAVYADDTGCFKVVSPFIETTSAKIFVKNSTGDNINFKADSSGITIEGTGDEFYYLYYVKDAGFVSPTTLECEPDLLDSASYDFSIPRTKTLYLIKDLESLETKYNADYEGLKEEFNYPITSDFAVFIREGDDILIGMKTTQPEKIVVNAKDIPILLLGETNGKEETEAVMNIQVW